MGVILVIFKIILVLLLCIPVAYVVFLIISGTTSEIVKKQKSEKFMKTREKGSRR